MSTLNVNESKLVPGAWVTLFFIFVVAVFNYLDRYVLSILLPAIKAELTLTDTQLGGIAAIFTISYVLLGIPIARLGDRYSRKTIISVSMAVWSVMTVACGFAQGLTQLAVARVMVGVGEAGSTPSSHSMISDYFPARMRARALAIFALGGPVGLIIGFILAGWLVETYSWRIAFIALGIPGVLAAGLFFIVVKEPIRGNADSKEREKEADESPQFLTTVKTLLGSPTFRNLSIATGLHTVVFSAAVSWLPSYFVRSFEMSMSEVGLWLAMSLGLSQLIGTFTAGVLTDLMVARDPRWFCWIPALSMVLSAPLLVIAFGTDSAVLSATLLAAAFLINSFRGPGTFAAIQSIAHVRMRAMAVAILIVIASLIGGLIGPVFTGWLSDYFVANFGNDSLKWSLMIVSGVFGLWAGLHDVAASRTIVKELAK